MCHELATQVNTSLWGKNELHNDYGVGGDELFTRRLPLKIGNEERWKQQSMHAYRRGAHKKNIEFLQFDMAVAHNFFIQ